MLCLSYRFILWGLLILLTGCATIPEKPLYVYSSKQRHYIYELKHWAFEGRLAVSGPKDSWSANVSWNHSPLMESMKLTGPLGQGAIVIQLKGEEVLIDRGKGDVFTSNEPEKFISQELGAFVPLKSLRYWAVGVPEQDKDFYEIGEGFSQDGWLVEYKQMQSIDGGGLMPQKISVTNGQVKLKLYVDDWKQIDVKPK
jgi:outer membrane lipoprotein LolB